MLTLPQYAPLAVTHDADQFAAELVARDGLCAEHLAAALRMVERGRLIIADAWGDPTSGHPLPDDRLATVIHASIVGLSDQQASQVAACVRRWMQTDEGRRVALEMARTGRDRLMAVAEIEDRS